MTLAIERLLAGPSLSREAMENFIRKHTFPIAEESKVTFLYVGEADAVFLQHWIYGLPTSQGFQRWKQTDFWFLVMELPDNSRIEYKLDVVRKGEHHWILDPLNPHQAHDPFGTNSVCSSYGYQRPDWTFEDPSVRKGSLEELSFYSRVFAEPRSFRVYLPARFRSSRLYPLLIVHDGEDFIRYAQMKIVLDNLIQRLEIAPMIVVWNQPGDRLKEYGADKRHADFLTGEVVPLLDRRYPLLKSGSSRGLMGGSFGAVASLATAWHYPEQYGRLLLQSGSFVFSEIGPHRRGPEFDPVVQFVNTLRSNPGRLSSRIFVNCGIYESLIYENRSLVPVLQRAGLEVKYVESRDGHNWENWRDRLRDALSWLFPGPLWMVYE